MTPKMVREVLTAAGAGWAHGGTNGKQHAVFVHEPTGASFTMSSTPRDPSSAKNYARQHAARALRDLASRAARVYRA